MVKRMTRTRWFQILVGLILFLLVVNLGISTFGVMASETETYDIDIMIDEDFENEEATFDINVTRDPAENFTLELYFENETVDIQNDTAKVSWSYTSEEYAEENYTFTELEDGEKYHFNLTVLEDDGTGNMTVVDYEAGSFTFGGSQFVSYIYSSAETSWDWMKANWYMAIILIGSLFSIKMYYDMK